MNFVRACSNSSKNMRYFLMTDIGRYFNCRNSNSGGVFNVNTNVAKDVIMYKNNNTRYFKYLNLFGLSQFGFWMYLSYNAFTSLRDAPVESDKLEELPWWRKINLGEQKYKNGLSLLFGLIGYMFLLGSFSYTIRSVRYLILRKGGKTVSFVTFGPFGKNAILNVPLNKMSAAESRTTARVQLPIKVEGKFMYYMLDMRGEFPNGQLFDATAGLRRKLH